MKADNVGTMLGFYVVSCDKTRESRLHDGRDGMLAETAFVPMNSGALQTINAFNRLCLKIFPGFNLCYSVCYRYHPH